MTGYEILTQGYPEPRIHWTPKTGPLAGVQLTRGVISKHPDHGRVVIFGEYPNREALAPLVAAKVLRKGQDVTGVLSKHPDLAEAVAEAEVAVAEELTRMQAEAETLEPIGLTYQTGGDGPNRLYLIWPEGATEYATKLAADRICAKTLSNYLKAADVEAVAVRETDPAESVYRGWVCDQAGAKALLTLAAERAAGVAAKAAEKQQARADEVARKKAEAVETGNPVLIASWTEPCNDRAQECNLDRCDQYAMPDGTIKVERVHTC